jgi:hypothetical protein
LVAFQPFVLGEPHDRDEDIEPPYAGVSIAGTSRTATLDTATAALLDRLLRLAITGLPRMYRPDQEIFSFTRAFSAANGEAELRGTSPRYSAIVALGAHWLPAPARLAVLGGQRLEEFVGLLTRRLDKTTNLGDAALICWAAAQSGHPDLDVALAWLRQLDRASGPRYVVEAAWVVSALAAARRLADVEAHLAAARHRLLASLHPSSPLFPHATAPGLVKPYRDHVACFADQVYPIQALARLHASGDDAVALTAARTCADRICRLQGPDGQWWWHYDARTGKVIEGYPVYTVHQHAMAPMALFDLAEAGGERSTASGGYAEPIRRGLRWIAGPAELGPDGESMIHDEQGVTWRKVYRGDPHKVVRGVHTLTSRAVPGLRVPGLSLLYRPDAVDRECRPYEFGWLFFAWLANLHTGQNGLSISHRTAQRRTQSGAE